MSESIFEALKKLTERERSLTAGEVLFRTGDPVLSLFLVTLGEVRLVRTLSNGSQLTLQRASAVSVLAEASLFADHYHCDAVAVVDAVVRAMPVHTVKRVLADNHVLASAFVRHLAGELHRTRSRAETLALKSVADRIDAWIALNGGKLPPKGRWSQVASEIGVTPEAFYRELACRRRTPSRSSIVMR